MAGDEDWPRRDEVERLSERFAALLTRAHCSACNGYYGPAFGQPVCTTCHAFLYANVHDAEINLQLLSEERHEGDSDSDHDSGNDEPNENLPEPPPAAAGANLAEAAASSSKDKEEDVLGQQLPARNLNVPSKAPSPRRNEVEPDQPVKSSSPSEHSATPEMVPTLEVDSTAEVSYPPDHHHEEQTKCLHHQNHHGSSGSSNQAWADAAVNDGQLQNMPPELLMMIFAYLDDISLYAVALTCKRWSEVLRSQTTSEEWKNYTQRRWPLFQSMKPISDWFTVYADLINASFCLTCIYQMAAEVVPSDEVSPALRKKRLGHDLRGLAGDSLEGIKAQPLDSSFYHWQASITGPAGSPYEGGIFYLYLKVPFTYPFDPPEVRFLTKVFHPNISRHGDIGIDIIQQYRWCIGLTIPKVLISIQSLLTDPYTNVCMEPEIGRIYVERRRLFDAIARNWTWKFAMTDVIR